MFVSLEQAHWPAPGEVRDLRVSLNAPLLPGSGVAPMATRGALGWLPAADERAVVRLWLREGPAPEDVRAYELGERPLGPAARERALEAAERFLTGLGFLFPDSGEGAEAEAGPAARTPRRAEGSFGAAFRSEGPLTKFRSRSAGRPTRPSSRGWLDRLVRPVSPRPGGIES